MPEVDDVVERVAAVLKPNLFRAFPNGQSRAHAEARAMARAAIAALQSSQPREERQTLCDDHRGSHAQGYWRAMEDVMHHINQLDSGGMTGREVRSAIYGFCLDARPALSQSPAIDPRVEELVEAAREARRLCDQARVDLALAFAEICKLQNLDPEKHSWPDWTPQANTMRWIRDKLIPSLDTALAAFVGKAE